MTAPLNVNQRLRVSISVKLCTAQWNYQSCETPSICFDLCVKWIWLLVNFFPFMFHCCLIVLSSVCTVLCLIAILDVQANQRAQCDVHCHWKSGIFSLPTYQQHTVCVHLESPAPASKELLKIILMVLQHHSATKKYDWTTHGALALNGENYLNFSHCLSSLRTPLCTQVRGEEFEFL